MSLQVEARGIELRYGGNLALKGVDLVVPAGELHAVIGPNGAGKTSLFAVIAGERRQARGEVRLAGQDIGRMSPARRVQAGLGRVFQVPRMFPELSVYENLAIAGLAGARATRTFWRTVRDREVAAAIGDTLEQIGLTDLRQVRARNLSHGDQRRLEIGIALSLTPGVLLLDEPTAGMSRAETEATVALVARLHRERGLTVILTEHDMEVVFQLAQVLTVMDQGRVLASGVPEEVRRRPEVKEAYLGTGDP